MLTVTILGTRNIQTNSKKTAIPVESPHSVSSSPNNPVVAACFDRQPAFCNRHLAAENRSGRTAAQECREIREDLAAQEDRRSKASEGRLKESLVI